MGIILVVEDDIHINGLLCDLLRQHCYEPLATYSGTEALLALPGSAVSLVLLDLMLPGKSGEEVLVALRKTSTVPVIVLTARADKATTVELLRLGADDYITKPFNNDELLARIEALLRRGAAAEPSHQTLRFRDVTVDLDSYDASIDGHPIGLSRREFEILRLLMSRPTTVFTKPMLYEAVWGTTYLADDNTINVHISKLRAKLAAINPGAEYIHTVWGVGFRMSEPK